MHSELIHLLHLVLENPEEGDWEKHIAEVMLRALYRSEQLREISGTEANYFERSNPLANRSIREGVGGQIDVMDKMVEELIRILFPRYI